MMSSSATGALDRLNEITPFWRRIPRFFLFPAHPQALQRVVLLSLLTALPLFLSMGALLLLLMMLVGWIIFFRYAYRVLEMTSHGYLSPAEYPNDASDDAQNRPYKQLVVIFVMLVLVGLVFSIFGMLGYLAYMLVLLVLPASVIVVAIEDSITQALNPVKLKHIISTIGWPYLAMCGFLFALLSSEGLLTHWLWQSQRPHLPAGTELTPQQMQALRDQFASAIKWLILFGNMVNMYFTLIMFNMIGYVLYQYHEALGLSAKADEEKAQVDLANRRISQQVAAGNIAQALDLAYEDQRINPGSIPAQQRYHKVLLLSPQRDRAVDHAKKFISLLVSQGYMEQSVEVYQNMLELDVNFSLAEASEVLPLARAAMELRKPNLALTVLRQFDQRYPHSNEIPNVYVYGAKVACEAFRRDEEARRILRAVLAKYPQHAAAGEARDYLQVMDKLSQS